MQDGGQYQNGPTATTAAAAARAAGMEGVAAAAGVQVPAGGGAAPDKQREGGAADGARVRGQDLPHGQLGRALPPDGREVRQGAISSVELGAGTFE